MKVIITALFMLALTTALVITLPKNKDDPGSDHEPLDKPHAPPPRRISRFLAANEKPRNPNAADHCHKNKQVCFLAEPLVGRNATCCNNKCKDLYYDDQNCGACKKKCRPFESCCRGECVNLSYDKRHCGACNYPCLPKRNSTAVCSYAICDYA